MLNREGKEFIAQIEIRHMEAGTRLGTGTCVAGGLALRLNHAMH